MHLAIAWGLLNVIGLGQRECWDTHELPLILAIRCGVFFSVILSADYGVLHPQSIQSKAETGVSRDSVNRRWKQRLTLSSVMHCNQLHVAARGICDDCCFMRQG